MGRGTCNPWICWLWPSAVVGNFKLEQNLALITTDTASWKFKVTADVKNAFQAFMKENDTNDVPNYGMAIVQGKNLKDAEVIAFLPFFDPTDFPRNLHKRLPHKEALDLYSQSFEKAVKKEGSGSCEK